MSEYVEVRADCYFDSIRLMQATAAMRAIDGVVDALAVMASAAGRGFLGDLGFDPVTNPTLTKAGAGDLVIVVRSREEHAYQAALAAFDQALHARSASSPDTAHGGIGLAPPPRTITSAIRAAGIDTKDAAELGIAVISVPGPHAFVEAMDALTAGLHVMLFSDNVSIEQERLLKQEAMRRDRLVMGPDCGTAIVSGVGLGFANAVAPGPVSLVGASGTGIQQLVCLLDEAGVGVRHALGTGGRDLSADIGGLSTLAALEALDRDPETKLIALVSKPPDADVAVRIKAAAESAQTPVISVFLGNPNRTLADAADEILRASELFRDRQPPPPQALLTEINPRPGVLRGLFAGGSLCTEARSIAATIIGSIATEESATGDASTATDSVPMHTMIDYGDDRFTRGRGHPMLDQQFRLERLAVAIADPDVSVILLDVTLGHGAHPDPASEIAPWLEHATAAGIAVVVVLCGTHRDPQDKARQQKRLHQAGAAVFSSNTAAARHAAALIAASSPKASV